MLNSLYGEQLDIARYYEIFEVLEKARNDGREGIVLKKMDSKYIGNRSNDWLKCKFFKETEIVLQSYTPNNAGIRCEDAQQNAVQISGEQHKEVKEFLDNDGECEVYIQYLEKTKDGRLRFPSYRGLTDEQKQKVYKGLNTNVYKGVNQSVESEV